MIHALMLCEARPIGPLIEAAHDVHRVRVRLEMADNNRDLALCNMAIDGKLRGCDLVRLRVNDVYAAGCVKERASVTQSKTHKPVRFEITETPRLSLDRWINNPEMISAGRRLRRSTRRRAICGRSSSCWVTRRWTARCATSASIRTTRCHCRKGSSSSTVGSVLNFVYPAGPCGLGYSSVEAFAEDEDEDEDYGELMRAANHSRTFRPSFSRLRMAR